MFYANLRGCNLINMLFFSSLVAILNIHILSLWKKTVLSFSAFCMFFPIIDFTGQSDVTEYILTIVQNLFKCHGVHKNSKEKKIG